MFFGMSMSFGRVPEPYAMLANAVLILQFPIVHSLLLTPKGGRNLARLAPSRTANAVNDDLRHCRVCTIACAVHIVDPKWHNLVGSLG